MTTYVASAELTFGEFSTTQRISIRPNSHELKIARIELCQTSASGSGFASVIWIYRYNSDVSITGGSAMTVAPLRQGSPNSTVTARREVTVSGTNLFFGRLHAIGIASTVIYDPPYDLTVSPGSALVIAAGGQGWNQTQLISVYFEELRLSWHY